MSQLPGLSLGPDSVAYDVGKPVQYRGYYQYCYYYFRREVLPEPCRREDHGQGPGAYDEVQLIYDEELRPLFSPRRRLKKAATISPSMAPSDRPIKTGSCPRPVPKVGRPRAGAARFSRRPARMPQTVPAIVPRKVLPSPSIRLPSWKVWPKSRGSAAAEEDCAVVGQVGRQHQPDRVNQYVHGTLRSLASSPIYQIIHCN